LKIYVTISFNKSLPDNEGFSLSKVIDESVKFIKLKKNNDINYKVISRHKEKLYNNRYYHYIDPDNYFVNILSIIFKVFLKKSLLKHYFDSSSRDNIKYTLALVFFILFKINKSDLILFHGSYKVLVFFSKILPNYNFIYYRHGGNMQNIPPNELNNIVSFCKGRIIHVSRTTHKQVKIAQKKSIVIHNGLSDNEFEKFRFNKNVIRERIRRKYNLDDNTLILFMGGIIWKPKGYHLAIKALSKYENDSIALFIAGDLNYASPNYIEELFHLSKESCRRTIFLGRLNRQSLYEHIVSSDIGLQLTDSDKCSEGISIILLEMMFLGLPIICTDSGGNGEVIQNKYNGFIININETPDQISQTIKKLNDTELKTKIELNSLKSVKENFSSEKMAMKLFDYLYLQSNRYI
tara:strand:+ start:7870 stop:9090 length:1221 start_codon:yes stop_codon:yes gene_type:complete